MIFFLKKNKRLKNNHTQISIGEMYPDLYREGVPISLSGGCTQISIGVGVYPDLYRGAVPRSLSLYLLATYEQMEFQHTDFLKTLIKYS